MTRPQPPRQSPPLVLALSGGVGGAKLAYGLASVLPSDCLTIVTNTGDDFEHLGLYIAPDVDSVLYTLAGIANSRTGWGRADESWRFLETLAELGGETWFRLGDRDLALHVERTHRLRSGETLSAVTSHLSQQLGIGATLAPMSDQPVRTLVETKQGVLPFQHYFVRERCEPIVTGFRFDGVDEAEPAPALATTLASPDLGAVVFCPSNPFVSLDPILALPGVEEALRQSPVPKVGVSPIVGGRALRGPAAKMLQELEKPVSAAAVARYFADRGLLDGFVIDPVDQAMAPEIEALGVEVLVTETIMIEEALRVSLARATLDLAQRLDGKRRSA